MDVVPYKVQNYGLAWIACWHTKRNFEHSSDFTEQSISFIVHDQCNKFGFIKFHNFWITLAGAKYILHFSPVDSISSNTIYFFLKIFHFLFEKVNFSPVDSISSKTMLSLIELLALSNFTELTVNLPTSFYTQISNVKYKN